ncbi:uncharacterized protein PG998_009651 [Apiospora kogelbergensis]|uniref:Uncharacterized protein n=1 Tax=Apiospora kogelbergensis TaxID=1337665 RepID=A0AAW0R8G8_9PEZI
MQPAYRQFPQQQVPPRTPHSANPRRGGIDIPALATLKSAAPAGDREDKWKKPGHVPAPPVRSSRFNTNTL